jgi:hypothetical protein
MNVQRVKVWMGIYRVDNGVMSKVWMQTVSVHLNILCLYR